MGYLLIDHRDVPDVVLPNGFALGIGGKLLEYDTQACTHCQAVIKIVVRGVKKALETKYRCGRCAGPVCKYCAVLMAKNGGQCTSHWKAKLDAVLRTGRWMADYIYPYRTK